MFGVFHQRGEAAFGPEVGALRLFQGGEVGSSLQGGDRLHLPRRENARDHTINSDLSGNIFGNGSIVTRQQDGLEAEFLHGALLELHVHRGTAPAALVAPRPKFRHLRVAPDTTTRQRLLVWPLVVIITVALSPRWWPMSAW